MLRIDDWQILADHLSDAPGIATGRVDDCLSSDVTLFCDDLPLAGWQRFDFRNTIMPFDAGSHVRCAASHRIRQA